MANTFKNYRKNAVGTASEVAYVVASDATAILVGVNLANIASSQITVSVQLSGTHLVKDAPIPAGSSLSILDGKIVLESLDNLTISSSAASSCDVTISTLELT